MDIEYREYFPVMEGFLRDIQGYNVRSIAVVALFDEPDVHNMCAKYNAGPFELSDAAGVLNLHASYMYNQINSGDDDDAKEEKGFEPAY